MAGCQTEGCILTCDMSEVPRRAGQGPGRQVGWRPQLRAVRVQAGQEGLEAVGSQGLVGPLQLWDAGLAAARAEPVLGGRCSLHRGRRGSGQVQEGA